MSNLRMDSSTASLYIQSFGNQLTELNSFIKEVSNINETLSNNSVWKGPKNSDYTSQLSEFITSLEMSKKIIEKTKNDLQSCVNNDINADLA